MAKSRIRLFVALAASLLVATALVASKRLQSDDKDSGLRRRLSDHVGASHTLKPKPIIYTFYHKFNGAEGGGTGMTAEADQVLLTLWKGEWANAGWVPRVLTMEDARQHPHFGTLDGMLNGLPFKMYDRLCFLRWLAMANQPGGGFLADYDTFPLAWSSDTLPFGGRLTVYEYTPNGGVPSLVSANQNEWFRFAWALVENAVQHANEDHWSDMKAMQDIYVTSGEEAYIVASSVLPGMAVLNGKGYPPEVCDRAARALAIHFSHHSVDKGILPEGTTESGPQARAAVAEEWLKQWRKNCQVQSVASSMFQDQSLAQVELSSIQNGEPQLEFQNAMAPRGAKPVIFTFYENVDEPQHTGMTLADDMELIQAWARSWQEMGWEPRVLDVNVARQHPEFATFDGFLEGLPFRKFDRICFYRYLAMGMAGGGWMSDYDTFPLNRAQWDGSGDPAFLPSNGALVVHEMSKSGGVPSLVSGNANEWFRLAKAQVENARAHEAEAHWSDMKALQDLYQKSGGTFYQMQENVVMGDAMLRNREIGRETCTWLNAKLAIHFSHFSMHNSGRFKEALEGARKRAPVGRSWLQEYRKACQAWAEQS